MPSPSTRTSINTLTTGRKWSNRSTERYSEDGKRCGARITGVGPALPCTRSPDLAVSSGRVTG